jgi:hypothetical protein
MSTFNKLFFSMESDAGKKKQQMLNTKRVISPSVDDLASFRVTWEYIQHHITHGKKRIIEMMERAKQNSHLAFIYAGVSSRSPVDVFFEGLDRIILPTSIPEYVPGNGIDIDSFLIINDEKNLRYRTEFFPRRKKGYISTEYGSHLCFEAPLLVGSNQCEPKDIIVTFACGEYLNSSCSREQIADIWQKHVGRWLLTEPRSIYLFLNNMAFSHIEFASPTNQPMVFGGATVLRNTGDEEEALLTFGNSKPKNKRRQRE